jgi:uncharacterized integral membrane protein
MPRCRRATRHKNRRSGPPESLTVAWFGRADVLPIGKATSPAEFDQQPEDVARVRGTARSAPWVGFIQHAYCGADTRGECRGGRRVHALAGPHRVGCARTFITAGEDKTDDAVGGRLGEPPEDSSKGRLDQAPEPVPDPGLRPGPAAAEPVIAPRTAGPTSGTAAIQHSRTGGLWAGLILSALVLLHLLVFILQNGNPVQISFFALEGVFPVGVALLLAAIAGVLLVAIPGSLRIIQLRRAARRGLTRKG